MLLAAGPVRLSYRAVKMPCYPTATHNDAAAMLSAGAGSRGGCGKVTAVETARWADGIHFGRI